MSQRRHAGDPRLAEGRATARVDRIDNGAAGAEHRREANTGEGVESSRDGVTHHGLADDSQSNQPAPRRSESPLFEPMDDTDPEHDDLFNDATAAFEALDKADEVSAMSHDTSLDGLKRAREIKKHIPSLHILAPKQVRSRARAVEEDPDNQAIKKMRQEDNMSWEAIVAYLNKGRLERSEPQTWTAAAVYSRFVRNAPRIAAAKGEYGFRPADYMHLRNPQSHPAAQLPGAINDPSGYQFGAGGGRKRVRDENHAAKDLADNLRQPVSDTLSEQTEILKKADMTELMMEAVATVEQEFWGTVANALEKKTGKLFDAKVLESRYHEIKWYVLPLDEWR